MGFFTTKNTRDGRESKSLYQSERFRQDIQGYSLRLTSSSHRTIGNCHPIPSHDSIIVPSCKTLIHIVFQTLPHSIGGCDGLPRFPHGGTAIARSWPSCFTRTGTRGSSQASRMASSLYGCWRHNTRRSSSEDSVFSIGDCSIPTVVNLMGSGVP